MKYTYFCYLKNIYNGQILFLLQIKTLSVLRLLSISLIFSFSFPSNSQAVDIIINNTVPKHHYSLDNVRAIFMMRMTQWSNGAGIKVFVLADNHPSHRNFVKNKLQSTHYQLRKYWDRLVYSGTGDKPIEVDSLTEMLHKVATTPYAIGYIEEEKERHANIRLLEY